MRNKKDCCAAESGVRLEKAGIGKNNMANYIPLFLAAIILLVSLAQTFDILSMQNAISPDAAIQNAVVTAKASAQAAPTMVGGC